MTVSNDEILQELKALRRDVEAHRSETRAEFKAVRAHLRTVEYGVLTMAQKLLAGEEVDELRERMVATG